MGMARALWFSIGILALLLGVIGTLLPIMPTAPFVIVAAFAFSRSSARFEAWLLRTPAFGPVIRDWRERGAIAPHVKVISTAAMAGSVPLGLILGLPWPLFAAQALCLALAAAFVLTRPSE